MIPVVVTLAERPELEPLIDDFAGTWPQFMLNDRVAPVYFDVATSVYPEYCLLALDPDRPDRPDRALARGNCVPFTSDGPLPAGGWDSVILGAAADRVAGRVGDLVSALEISVRPEARGTGLAAVMLDAMRRNAARLGYAELVAPVRPNAKHLHPHTPINGYAASTRGDGLPVDPWLRVHVRAGGRIESVAPRSMIVAGSLAEWRDWTKLPFDRTGPVIVPEALVPVHCDVDQDHAVYVEPNVWIRHRLT